jgi:hypothetical protein
MRTLLLAGLLSAASPTTDVLEISSPIDFNSGFSGKGSIYTIKDSVSGKRFLIVISTAGVAIQPIN